MAFKKSQLTRVNLNPTGNEQGNWVYITQDLLATVEASGYFPLTSELREFEILYVSYINPDDREDLKMRKYYRIDAPDVVGNKVNMTPSSELTVDFT